MMFSPGPYPRWIRKYHGRIPFDLAWSGAPSVALSELGDPGPLDAPSGWARLCAAVARYNDVPEAEALPAMGTLGAIWLAYTALASPDDEILVEHPAYEPLWRTAASVCGHVRRFERSLSDGYRLDPSRVAEAMTARTRVIVVTNLHNPSGVRASDDDLRETARLARDHGAYLLVDEVYGPLDALTDGAGVWAQSARKLGPNVLAAASLGKCHGLPSERIGWLLGPPEVIERAEGVIAATMGRLPLSHANLGAHAFGHIEALAARCRAELAGKRQIVEAWCKTRPDLSWSAPREGLFGFAVAQGAGDLLPRIERGASERGVLVAAGTFFGVPEGFRLAWALPLERLADALAELDEALPPGLARSCAIE